MELATAKREVQTGGDLGFKVDYTIEMENLAHVMWVLRTGLYTRKALAVIREYSSNAWDIHQETGVGDTPIKVFVPTWTKPTFSVRDYGTGLGREDIPIFASFGASTKRGAVADCTDCDTLRVDAVHPERVFCPVCEEANARAKKAVGALGIGSKAGFCIGDTFSITSWHEGTKSIYRSAIGEDNKGTMTLMHEEPCGDETGIEIKVPVPQGMIYEFEREARSLFRYMRPQPEINVALSTLPEGLPGGYITREGPGTWTGVMGCVPYRIDLDQLQEQLREEGLYEPLNKLGGAVYLPIGEVEFAANREELQYTKVTRDAIVFRFKTLVQDYTDDAIRSLTSGEGTGWDRRSKAVFMSSGLGFKLPRKYDFWTSHAVPLWRKESGQTAPKTFSLFNHDNASCTNIPISTDTVLLLKDPTDPRKTQGWQLQRKDILVDPRDGETLEAVQAELEAMLPLANLDGVPIHNLKQVRSWYAPSISTYGGRTHNAKHKQRTFEMTGTSSYGTLSENWTKADPPQDEHVYFIINAFKFKGSTNFYEVVARDKTLAKAMGLLFPTLYGYKTTLKKPVVPNDVDKGTPYYTWRKEFFKVAWSNKRQQDYRDLQWSRLFRSMPYKFSDHYRKENNFLRQLPTIIEKLEAALGRKHVVTRYFARQPEALKVVRKWKQGYQSNLDTLSSMFPGRKRNPAECALDRLLKAYPMLSLKVEDDNDMHIFMTHFDLLLGYIAETDRAQL